MHIHTHTQNKRYKPKIKRACEAGFQGTGRAWRRPCVRLICLPYMSAWMRLTSALRVWFICLSKCVLYVSYMRGRFPGCDLACMLMAIHICLTCALYVCLNVSFMCLTCALYVCLNAFYMCLKCGAGFQGACLRACVWQSIYALRVPYMFAWMRPSYPLNVGRFPGCGFAWMRMAMGDVLYTWMCVYSGWCTL